MPKRVPEMPLPGSEYAIIGSAVGSSGSHGSPNMIGLRYAEDGWNSFIIGCFSQGTLMRWNLLLRRFSEEEETAYQVMKS